MIEITVEKEHGRYRMEIKGHAGHAETGKDIVCAAVSTLGYTLANVYDKMMDDGELDNLEITILKGYMLVEAYGTGKAEIVFETIATGLFMIAEKYPENVRVNGG